MKLKGNYSADASYSVGDVVREDGVIYVLQKEAAAGTDPRNTLYWNRVAQPVADMASLAIDAVELAQGEVGKYFFNDQTLLLKAGEGESEKTYAVTVDDSGDTPDLAVAEVSEEGES